MTSKKDRLVRNILAAAAILFLAACQTRPITTTQEHAVPPGAQALPLNAIELAIVEAGARRGWRFQHIADGQVRATYTKWPWVAEADVLFSNRSYRIQYVSAKNMERSNDGVERAYNRWVGNLERDIAARLDQIATRR
ncbi:MULTISPECIES: hypothetical protein [Azospirillum]|uniref:Lipoprotein n=1 Tax=Azospirillum brasilense TaxID=192 RepID=A0ABU4PD63_AZOBR|nr:MULTISPECIES: hypothetical protein [Azospirillum]MDW7552329.1 hypothetical protein [Azospirillum brasilense]MDW7592480.1 hypothetical protein [Azospirillum brasilense]MDW7596508.1 hypothetical protein [Azospirillum brasilense]MDW7627609.1 hypothetical protein [Azospirillum brasilense]MDW7628825.1 hypothetical protein [Azospirillum brasilense]